LTAAASALINPNAQKNRRGKTRPETGKLRRARSLCAPQYASAGTSISPRLSRSLRVAAIVSSPAGNGAGLSPVLAS